MAGRNGNRKVVEFSTEKELRKIYKKMSTADVEAWAKSLDAEYKACPEHEAIHRMRVCMAILYHYFPRQTKPKQESPYKQYSLEQLIELAATHDVPVEATDDMRILRMRLIMALRAHKIVQ